MGKNIELACRMISVIIPAYNASKTIEKCITSVLNQTHTAIYQILIVNDGSSDNTVEIVESVIKKNSLSNIQIINKPNGGVSSARNAGMQVAKGEFIAFLDSDDAWLPQKIEKQLIVFEQYPDVFFVGTTMNGMVFKKFFCKKFSKTTEITLKNLLFKNFFQPSTVIMRKEIIEKIGFFDENQRYAEEGNYFMRIAFKYKCVLLNESLLIFGDGKRGFGTSGLSANIKEMEKGELKNLKYARKHLNINFFLYGIAVSFSILKYLRRIVIVKIKG